MAYNPTVSEFSLFHQHPQAQTPYLSNRNSQLDRSRNRFQKTQRIYHPQNHVSFRPQEVIIDVSLNNPQTNSKNRQKSQEKQGGIRNHIDACLNAIETAYHQEKIRQNSSKSQNQPTNNDRTIHRIDTNLVLEYTRTICKDYKLRDRFGNQQPHIRMPISHQRQSHYISSPNNQQRYQSLGSERNRKQFLNLTQASKINKRAFSSNKKQIEQPTSPRTHHQIYSINASPQIMANEIKFARLKSPLDAKIEQDFRYCINCQATILSKNVDFHQKYQCKDFSALYKLSFSDLSALVAEKVLKINKQLKKRVEWLKQKDLSKSRSESICNQTLQKIEEYANDTLNTSFDKTNLDYHRIKDSLNNQYIEVVKMTHKLHWFNQVYANLKNESTKRRASSRVSDLNCFAPGVKPVFQQTKVVPPSPIAQLYPHLHKPSLNSPPPFNPS